MWQVFEELKRRNVLRIAVAYLTVSWLLIQVADTIFPAYNLPGSALTILITILAMGFIPAIILAWALELTPEGIQWDADVEREARQKPAARTFIDRFIMVTLTLALGYFAIDKFVIDPARDAEREEAVAEQARVDALMGSYGDNSIAVLPFVNMSDDPAQDYLSDGIAEELLNLLTNVRELRVTSRSSSFIFKGQDIAVPAIAEKLKVAHVLEGSVRKASNRVRIAVQLIDARTDTQLWSQIYDRELDDVFAIQDEISAHVVERLRITLLDDLPRAEQMDSEAYNLFLKARHIIHSRQLGKLSQAERFINEALIIEPDNIHVLSLLGRAYIASWRSGSRSYDDMALLLRGIVARISTLQPESLINLGWQAWNAFFLDNDLAAAAPLWERVLKLRPRDVELLRGLIPYLMYIGYFEEAAQTADYVTLRDPTCAMCLFNLSLALRHTGRYDRAVEVLEDAVAWDPDRPELYWSLGSALLAAGRPEEAIAAFEKETVSRLREYGRIFALHDLGRPQEFEQAFAKIRSDPSNRAESIARIYAWTGDYDLALVYLEKTVEKEGPEILRTLTLGGWYEGLERDPRFDALLRKHGQHPDQSERIQLEFISPE